jgi:hypothetical protein
MDKEWITAATHIEFTISVALEHSCDEACLGANQKVRLAL